MQERKFERHIEETRVGGIHIDWIEQRRCILSIEMRC